MGYSLWGCRESDTTEHARKETYLHWASLVAQWERIYLLMQETRVQSLGPEDPLEKDMATHSSILAWEIPWTEEPGRLLFLVLQRV